MRCRRLLVRCSHCGTEESDFIRGGFAEVHLAGNIVVLAARFVAGGEAPLRRYAPGRRSSATPFVAAWDDVQCGNRP